MSIKRGIVSMFFVGLVLLGTNVIQGQDYPTKPIRIVTSGLGGGNDVVSRLIAPGLSAPLGQPVIVENRANNLIGEIVAKALPDGHTLLLAGNTLWIGPLLAKTPYDPVSDFSPIISVSVEPTVLVVHPSLPVKSVKEFIALAKAKPGVLNYGSTGTGGSAHLAPELFKSMAGVNIIRVPYKGVGQVVSDLLGGQVQMAMISASSVVPHVKSGRLKALAVTSQPTELMPGVPTLAAVGLPGYKWEQSQGMFAPARTPVTIIKRLNQEITRTLNQPDVKEKLLSLGQEVLGGSPEQLEATVKSEMVKVGKLVKDAGITAD